MGEVKLKRAYRSPRRQEQAAGTRLAILAAAGRLFIEHGYAGTTIDAIAAAAEVAAVTVYATFGGKRAILDQLIATSLVGDEKPMPLLETSGPQAVRRESDQRRQVAMFAAGIAEIMERISPIFEVMRNAAAIEPEIAELLDGLLRERISGMRFFVDALMRNGPLRGGVSVEAATETTWALSSPDLHWLVTLRLGWTRDRYRNWLRDTLAAALLPE